MVEIIKQLKKILKGVSTLQGVAFNHHTRHEEGGGDEISIVTKREANIRFCIQGTAKVSTKVIQALIGEAVTISKVKVHADDAPTGASLIVDINKNGTTIFTTQANRPAIASGGHADDSGTPNITSFSEGDRLSVDIDQVGSTVAGGNDLMVTVITS